MAENTSPDPEIETEAEEKAQNYVLALIRNSPWLAIAVLLHVMVIAIMSVWYLADDTKKEVESITAVSIAKNDNFLPPPIETPPEIIDRNSVPVQDAKDEGPVNPDENYIPDAAAGRQGEITDEVDPNKEAGIFNPDPEALSNAPSGATGGTPIGVGAVGHFGTGTPSAFVSRRAGGGGRGGGGLGQGGGGGRGGKLAEDTVNNALLWLKKHQSPDGHWDSAGFSAQCKEGTCSDAGESPHDVGLTGLALLCYLGAGQTHTDGYYKETVKNGLKYLISQQDPDDGCFGQKIGQHFLYNHACAAIAMAEAYGMTQANPFKEPAQKGINFILRAQNPYRAWRYAFPPDGDNDTSVTGWMVMALKSAKMSGLIIDEAAMQNAMNWVTEMTDPATGKTGYIDMGGLPSRLTELMTKFPAEKSESMTAVGMLVRIFAEHSAEEDPMISKGADLCIARPPTWETTGEIDYYYWYYATLAMFQVGGPRWEKWNAALKTAVIDHQRNVKGECEFGSWDGMDPWCKAGGRVYATAINCLTMEVYYRYPKVFGAKTDPKKDDKKKRTSRKSGRRLATAETTRLRRTAGNTL